MKFNPRKFLVEEDSGAAGGYMGYASDAESYIQTPYKGLSDPRNSTGAFGSVFQNRPEFKPMKTLDVPQLDQLQAAIHSYLCGTVADPRQAIYNLKVKLNHLGFDFDFNRNVPLQEGPVTFQLSRYGQKFGTTPTNDLMKGFDRGQDYTNVALTFNVMKDPSGQYNFSDIKIGQSGQVQQQPAQQPAQQPKMQAESFYQYMGSDQYVVENLFNPIMANIFEKLDKDELNENNLFSHLSFLVERTAKRMNMKLEESDVSNLVDGLVNMMMEEEKITKSTPPKGTVGKETGEMVSTTPVDRRRRRAEAIKRLKSGIKK